MVVVQANPKVCRASLVKQNAVDSHVDVAAETLLWGLQRFLESSSNAQLDPSDICRQIERATGIALAPQGHNQQAYTEDATSSDLAKQFRHNFLLDPDNVKSRQTRLVQLAQDEGSKNLVPDIAVIRRLVVEVLRLPLALSNATPQSRTILQIHRVILAKLDARSGGASGAPSVSDVDVEKCEICSAGISFESLRWARCANGHDFCELDYPSAYQSC